MAVPSEFATWLNLKLQELNTDETIFGSYIIGILEGDEEYEEKHEALEGILSEILTENLNNIVQSILTKWSDCNEKIESTSNRTSDAKVEEKLVKLLESTKIQSTVKERHYTDEEKKIREQILAQYSQTAVSEEEFEGTLSDEDNVSKHGSNSTKSSGIERNTNFSDVVAIQKEKREQARLESAAKKQKDREDREKQKQIREEKKEKRKTVKGERRR